MLEQYLARNELLDDTSHGPPWECIPNLSAN